MHFVNYNRNNALAYAKEWAMARNNNYLNFDSIGGDCTNFASQCLYAGIGVMNYQKDIGWYYNSPTDRAAAWSSAKHFVRFLLGNKSEGPFAVAIPIEHLELGDFICLNNNTEFYHSTVVTGFDNGIALVSAHTGDSYMRRIDTYHYAFAQGIHILGANKY